MTCKGKDFDSAILYLIIKTISEVISFPLNIFEHQIFFTDCKLQIVCYTNINTQLCHMQFVAVFLKYLQEIREQAFIPGLQTPT